jgi:hypothetical protein
MLESTWTMFFKLDELQLRYCVLKLGNVVGGGGLPAIRNRLKHVT